MARMSFLGSSGRLDRRPIRLASKHARIERRARRIREGLGDVGLVARDDVQNAPVIHELHRPRGPCVLLHDGAGRRIEHGDRRRVSGRAIDDVPHGGQPPLDLHGHLLVADVGRVPVGKHDPPEDDPVVGVAGHERVFTRQRRVLRRAEVLDGEQAALRRDHAVDRRHREVRSLPLRLAQPLIPPGRTDDGVLGHGVVVRAVIVLFPFVGAWQLRLDRHGPFAVPLDRRGAVGPEHPHEFVRRNRAGVLADDERRQVVDVGEFLSAPVHDGNRAVQSERTDGRARRFDTFRVGLQSLNDTVVRQSQRRSEFPVPAADVDDQAAVEAGQGAICLASSAGPAKTAGAIVANRMPRTETIRSETDVARKDSTVCIEMLLHLPGMSTQRRRDARWEMSDQQEFVSSRQPPYAIIAAAAVSTRHDASATCTPSGYSTAANECRERVRPCQTPGRR